MLAIDSKTGLAFPTQTCAVCKPDNKYINPLDADSKRCADCDQHYACAQCLVCPTKFLRRQWGVGNACCEEHNVQPVASVKVSIYPHDRQLPTFSHNVEVPLPITHDALRKALLHSITVDQFLAASAKTVGVWTDDFATGDSFSGAQRDKYRDVSLRGFVAAVAADDFACDDKVSKFFPHFAWGKLSFAQLNSIMDKSASELDSFVMSLCRGTDRTIERTRNVWSEKTEFPLFELVKECGEIRNGQVSLNVHLLQSSEVPAVRVPVPVGRPDPIKESDSVISNEKLPACHAAFPWLAKFGFSYKETIAALGSSMQDLRPTPVLERFAKTPIVENNGRWFIAAVPASKTGGSDFLCSHSTVCHMSPEFAFDTYQCKNQVKVNVIVFQFASKDSAKTARDAIANAAVEFKAQRLGNFLNRCFLELSQLGHGVGFTGTDSPHLATFARRLIQDDKPKTNRKRRTRKRIRKDDDDDDEEEEEQEEEEQMHMEVDPVPMVRIFRDFNDPSIEQSEASSSEESLPKRTKQDVSFNEEYLAQIANDGFQNLNEPDVLASSIENFHAINC